MVPAIHQLQWVSSAVSHRCPKLLDVILSGVGIEQLIYLYAKVTSLPPPLCSSVYLWDHRLLARGVQSPCNRRRWHWLVWPPSIHCCQLLSLRRWMDSGCFSKSSGPPRLLSDQASWRYCCLFFVAACCEVVCITPRCSCLGAVAQSTAPFRDHCCVATYCWTGASGIRRLRRCGVTSWQSWRTS